MASGTSLDDLCFVGMVGIIDPERPQVEKAITQLKRGGVIVKMITGDAEKTAKAICWSSTRLTRGIRSMIFFARFSITFENLHDQ
jgi:magnesium-transporting ATPase (P-type)